MFPNARIRVQFTVDDHINNFDSHLILPCFPYAKKHITSEQGHT